MSKGTLIVFSGSSSVPPRPASAATSAPNFGCTQGATVALTIVAGPLNYIGLDPQIACTTPKPSGS